MSSGFVTESEITETRRKRQEEWERVRNADQPLEAPEDTYDSRCLFDRLQEQKQKKDLEYEEAHKLKNMIKGLDDDEVEFLDLVDRSKLAAERKVTLDEERELNDYRSRVASLQEKSFDQRIHAEISVIAKPKTQPTNRQSQMKLLKGVVVKKTEPKKRKLSECDSEIVEESPKKLITTIIDKKHFTKVDSTQKQKLDEEDDDGPLHRHTQGALTCIGILPGLGCYSDSSESEVTSESDDESSKIDILGRVIKKDKSE